jgi:hypothetical protein
MQHGGVGVRKMAEDYAGDATPYLHPLRGVLHKQSEREVSPTIDYIEALLLRLRDAGAYHYSDGRITIDIERTSSANPQSTTIREGYKARV